MKRILGVIMLSAGLSPAFAADPDIGVSVTIGHPGFYGTIEIGDTRPRLIYAEPKYIYRAPRGEVVHPLYLRVPPGHARNWRKHCHKYDACGRPAYFVQDSWYRSVYVPHYRERHRDDRRDGDDRDWRDDRGEGRDRHKGKGRDNGKKGRGRD